MKFLQENFGERVSHVLLNEVSGENIAIIPSCGAMLNAFNVKQRNGAYFEVLKGYDSEEDLINNIGHSFRGCKLSPFPNRVNGGKYSFGGQTFQLHVNLKSEGHAHHGLVYDAPFELTECFVDDDVAALGYRYIYNHDRPGYPFKYQLDVQYQFNSKNQMTCTTTVTNLDDQDIPVGDGWHPVFNAHPTVDDLYIRFQAGRQLVLQNMLPNLEFMEDGEYREFKKVGPRQFDNCYELINNSKAVFSIAYPSLEMVVDIWQLTGAEGYSYLQVYTPDSRDSIAVEPVTCPADSLNNRLGLITLAPGNQLTLAYGVDVSFAAPESRQPNEHFKKANEK